MKPVVRQYTNDEKLMKDVEELREIGVAREDIYVLSHDDDRTERLANRISILMSVHSCYLSSCFDVFL